MARKGEDYSDEQLAKMYRRYAELKGWSTRDEVVQDKVQAWRDSSIGSVGLAIDFYETGTDNAKHLGRNAETESAQQEGSDGTGCFGVFAAFLITVGVSLAAVFSL